MLMSRLEEGVLSKKGFFTLLCSVPDQAFASYPPKLLSLLEEVEKHSRKVESLGNGEHFQSFNVEGHNSNEEPGQLKQINENKKKTEEEGQYKDSTLCSQAYSCCWCKKGFAFKCRMLAHSRRCSMSQDLKHGCLLCPEVFPTQRALQRHRSQAHQDTQRCNKKVSCDLCGRTFAHPSGMIYHKRTEHYDEKPFGCEECGAKFGANSSLKNHIRLHTGEKPYRCKHCDMSFSVAAALAYHTKKKHSEGKMYACQYCEALFAQSIELTRHVRTHTGDKPYVCRECGKGYSQASGLTVHLQSFHNITEPHDCQKCRLSFPSLEEHRQHIQDFHPRDFYKCSVCSKVFPSTATLDKHKCLHTGTKPFNCDLCHKSYQQLSGLWYHNRTTHPEVFTNQSSRQLKALVQCDICFKFFPNVGSMAKHQTIDHPDLGLHCAYCPALLASEADMQDHISMQHAALHTAPPSPAHSPSQLQRHLLACHTEPEEQLSAATVIPMEQTDDRTETVIGSQQVFVTLGDGKVGAASAEVVAVNMEDLLNGGVTLIFQDKQ